MQATILSAPPRITAQSPTLARPVMMGRVALDNGETWEVVVMEGATEEAVGRLWERHPAAFRKANNFQ